MASYVENHSMAYPNHYSINITTCNLKYYHLKIDGDISFYYATNQNLQELLALYTDDAIAEGITTLKKLKDEIRETFESTRPQVPPTY